MRPQIADHCKSCTQDMRTKLALSSLLSRRCFLRFQIVYKIVHNVNCLDQLKNYQTALKDHNYTTERSLRDAIQLDLGDAMSSDRLSLPLPRTGTIFRTS